MTARILDKSFKYTPAAAQSVMETWRKAGFKPTTQAERNARIRRQMSAAPQERYSKGAPEALSAVAAPPQINVAPQAIASEEVQEPSRPAVAAPKQINAAPQAPAGNIGMPANLHRAEAPAVAAPNVRQMRRASK